MKNFIGQKRNLANLEIYIKAANQRDEVLDHILITGAPGTGKSTLCKIIEIKSQRKMISLMGYNILSPKDIISIVTKLEENDILFVDEIHLVKKDVIETFYKIMQEFKLEILMGDGFDQDVVEIEINKFTLVCASTKIGKLPKPFLDRFPINIAMQEYHNDEINEIITKQFINRDISIEKNVYESFKELTNSNPRNSILLSKRIIDFCLVGKIKILTKEEFLKIIKQMGINKYGLDITQLNLILQIYKFFKLKPIGIDLICNQFFIEKENFLKIVEPKLIQTGLLVKTNKGRMLTNKAVVMIKEINDKSKKYC